MKRRLTTSRSATRPLRGDYDGMLLGVVSLLESARRTAARSVNALMTATCWEIGRRIVEYEQHGARRAGYGEEVLLRLSRDLRSRFGRGFSRPNLQRFRDFYRAFPVSKIRSTLSSNLSVCSLTALPEENLLAAGVGRTRKRLEGRR